MILSAPDQLVYKPRRIISLVPSQTELLFSLGLEAETMAITKFCIHPKKWFQQKMRIGGTKTIDLKKIESLQPDLIIANKEENVQEQVAAIAEKFPVWVTDVNDLNSSLSMINDIGMLTHKHPEAASLAQTIKNNFDNLSAFNPLPAAYLIWKDPYMTIGSDTFIHDMMTFAGFDNVFKTKSRYPEITVNDIRESKARVVLLSSEPYPFKEKHVLQMEQALPGVQIILADGELFSWYGSRLLQSPQYFLSLRKRLHS